MPTSPTVVAKLNIAELERTATQVRRDVVRQVHGVQSGHPGGSLGCTDFLTALYFHVMDHDPSVWDMDGKGQDLFFLSNGHISPVFYSVLARSGYFPVKESPHSETRYALQGHPTTHEGYLASCASGSWGKGLVYNGLRWRKAEQR